MAPKKVKKVETTSRREQQQQQQQQQPPRTPSPMVRVASALSNSVTGARNVGRATVRGAVSAGRAGRTALAVARRHVTPGNTARVLNVINRALTIYGIINGVNGILPPAGNIGVVDAMRELSLRIGALTLNTMQGTDRFVSMIGTFLSLFGTYVIIAGGTVAFLEVSTVVTHSITRFVDAFVSIFSSQRRIEQNELHQMQQQIAELQQTIDETQRQQREQRRRDRSGSGSRNRRHRRRREPSTSESSSSEEEEQQTRTRQTRSNRRDEDEGDGYTFGLADILRRRT